MNAPTVWAASSLLPFKIFDKRFQINGKILVEAGGAKHGFIDKACARILAGDIIGGHVVVNLRAGLVGGNGVGNLQRRLNGWC